MRWYLKGSFTTFCLLLGHCAFVISFKNDVIDPATDSFNIYHMSLVEFKKFNALIDNKPIFDQPIKDKHEAYENVT